MNFSQNLSINFVNSVLDKIVVKPSSCFQFRIFSDKEISNISQDLLLEVYVNQHSFPFSAPKLIRLFVVGNQNRALSFVVNSKCRIVFTAADSVLTNCFFLLFGDHQVPVELHYFKRT